ncbi:MAG TPA: hypothetical protein VFP50_02240 [Anaeromyxobacteraceae bacterium]|nr:hypothetical protein [Anaeromyxobacteraceae bacterium]
MRTHAVPAVLVAVLAAAPVAALAARKPAPVQKIAPSALSDEEKNACDGELDVLEKRTKLFAAQGLAPAEVAKRNEAAQAALDECVNAFRAKRGAEKERLADLNELERRTGPNASDAVRAEAWAQIRRERLAAKPPSELTAEEQAELNAGNKQELAETHATLDTTHARDPGFMRMVHSALACYHGVRRDRLRESLAHEESLVKLGQGDRNKLYALKSDLRQSDDVLARAREASKGFKEGLGKCTEEQVAILAHCLAIRFEGQRNEPACESEEIQQYIRFIK